MDSNSIGQLITFLTLVAGFIFQAYRENRNRRWDVEDRKAVAHRAVEAASAVADRLAITGDRITRQIDATTTDLTERIKENTEISTQAFKEANSVNLKIEKLGIDHNALQREAQDRQK